VKRHLAVVASLVLAAVAAFPTVAAAKGTYPPPVSQGQGTADPSRVGIGECTTFSGGGFRPASSVTVTDDGTYVRTVKAQLDGTFSAQVCFNSEAKPGRHTLEGRGVTPQGGTRIVTAVVYVLGQSVSHGGGGVNGNGNGGGNGNGSSTGGSNGSGHGGGNGAVNSANATTTGGHRSLQGSLALDAVAVLGIVVVGGGSMVLLGLERRARVRRRAALG